MAFETNDLRGILILVLFAIPTVASTNINCSGRAFHCVNSTHFMICVDLGGGVSTTIDDFVIPCPATTECNENNIFECDFPEVTTPPLKVIGVNKPSDISEPTLVTNSVTTPTPTSDIFSVLKENITATTLANAEDVTPVVKLEVLENFMNRVGVNNTTEMSVTSSLIDSKNDVFNDNQTSNNTITTSASDINKHLEHAVETSIHEAANASLTDKSTSIDKVTSVIGLFNLISTDPPSVVSTKPSSNVLTSLDSSNDNIATNEQYNTKEVTIHGIKVTDKLNASSDIIVSEKSLITDEVSTTPVLNTLILNALNNSTNSGYQTNAEQDIVGKSNNSNQIVPETTTKYVPPIKNVNISKLITVDLSPQTTTDHTLAPLGLVDLISAEQKQSTPGTNDNIDTFLGDTITTMNKQFNTKLETTLSAKPVIVEIISTTPMANKIVQNVLINDKNNYSDGEIFTVEKVTETTKYSTFSESTTVTNMQQASTENTFVPITTEDTKETIATSQALYKNDFPVQKQTILTQPSEIIIATDLPIVVTDNFYQINGELTKNISFDTMNITESNTTVYNDSGTDNINNKVIEPVLLLPHSMKNPAIEITTIETLQKGLTSPAIDVANESLAIIASNISEQSIKNDKNDTLLNNTATVNATSSDIANGKGTKPAVKQYPTIEISTTETVPHELSKHAIEAKNELPATSDRLNVNEHILENVEVKALLSVHAINSPYEVTTSPVKDTIIKDLPSKSNIATNQQIDFTPEIIAHKASESYTFIDHATTQKAIVDSVSKIPEPLNQPDNLEAMTHPETFNVDLWAVTDPDVVSTTMISLNNIENEVTTLFSSDVTKITSISEIIKPGNQNNTSTTNLVNTEDAFLKITETSTSPSNQNATELSSTTPETAHTTPSMDSIKMFKQVSANTPNIADFDRVSMTTTANNKSVSHFVPSTETTTIITVAGFDTKNIDFQTGLVNSTAILNPIEYTNGVNTFPESTVKTNKDEGIKIVSALDIVNSSGNAMPIEMSQPTNSNPPSTNDYIKTSESQASSVYVSATDNVPDYNSVHVERSATQKNPEAIITIADTKLIDMFVSKTRTHNLPVSEITKGKDQYVSTEAPVPTTVQLIKSTKTAINYVAEKTDGYSSTEIRLTPDTTTLDGFTKVPVYDEVTTVKDTAFITNSTQMTPEVVTDNSKVMKPQSVNYETESSLSSALMATESALTTTLVQTKSLDKTSQNIQPGILQPAVSPQYAMPTVNNYNPQSIPSLPIVGVTATQITTQITTEPTDAAVFTETTPLAAINKLNENVQIGIKTTQLPQYLTSKENNNSPQSMPLLPIVEAIAAQNTTKVNLTTVITQTTPLSATSKPNQDVLPEIQTTDLPQYVMSTVNNNIPQSISSLSMIGVTASQILTESTHTELFAQTKPLAATGYTKLGVLSGIKSADLPQYVSSTVGNNTPTLKPLLPLVEVTAAQFTTETIHKTKNSETTPLAAPSTTFQDILPGIKTTDLSQYATTTVIYYNAESVSDITTETIVDSLTAPDSMVETIIVVGDKESGKHLGETFLTPTVDNIKFVKNSIDHESIVLGATSKNDENNTSVASAKPVDINKAEIVNHTERNWMPADFNIDRVKIKESSIEDDDLKSSVLKSVTDIKNKTLVLNSSKISQILPNDGKSVDKIEYRLTTETTNYKTAESGAPKNVTQSKSIFPNGNKNAKTNSSQYANIEIIDSKKDHVPVDSNKILDHYIIVNNTKANNTSSNHNLSLQNSTINEELEQHLISTNHTITTEIQSHLNESDKQSNKTSNLLTLNETSVHNLNGTSANKNASSKNTSAITVPVSDFNCSNLLRGKYSDKKDCSKFYSCIGNLQPILGTCPNNTVFSEINKQCTRNLSHCVRNNQFRCLFEGRFSDFFKDNIYYICVKNRIHGFIRYKLQCQDSYHLNKDLVKCEKNEEISTQTGSSVSETINDESKPHSEKMVISDDFECEKVGKFPYDKDCSKYYECTKVKSVFRRKIKKCASDEVFDKKKKKCVESDSREC